MRGMDVHAGNLERALTALRSSAAHPGVVDWLAHTIAGGSDLDCYQINSFRVAEDLQIDRLDATRALLFATRLGLTDLGWDIHCPSCAGQPEFAARIQGASPAATLTQNRG